MPSTLHPPAPLATLVAFLAWARRVSAQCPQALLCRLLLFLHLDPVSPQRGFPAAPLPDSVCGEVRFAVSAGWFSPPEGSASRAGHMGGATRSRSLNEEGTCYEPCIHAASLSPWLVSLPRCQGGCQGGGAPEPPARPLDRGATQAGGGEGAAENPFHSPASPAWRSLCFLLVQNKEAVPARGAPVVGGRPCSWVHGRGAQPGSLRMALTPASEAAADGWRLLPLRSLFVQALPGQSFLPAQKRPQEVRIS